MAMLVSHMTPAVHTIDVLGPAAAAGLFVFVMSRFRDPPRRKVMAVMTAGFATAYLGGGLGIWEFWYFVPASLIAYRALDSYRFIALGWFMHPIWDLVHHFYGNPIWPWMPTSSIGCAIFDPIVAIYALTLARSQVRGRTPDPMGFQVPAA
jgi:hypothetical protein